MSTPAHLSRRAFLGAGGAALVAAGLAGCTPAGAGRETVLFLQWKPEAVPYFRELAAAFTAAHDEYRILHDMAVNLSASFVRGDPPDLGLIGYNLQMNRFLQRGALRDLSSIPAAQNIRPDVLDLADWYPTYAGRTSVLPYSVTAASVIYNRELFDQVGARVPETWTQFVAVCDAFMEAGVTPIYGTFSDAWTLAQGQFDYAVGGMVDVRGFYERMTALGEAVGPDSEVSFQKSFREPIEKILQLAPFYNGDATSRGYGDGNTAMANGTAAMYLQGPWAIAEIDKAGTGVELGTFPMPMTDDPDDRKIRVNLDLALWVPEIAGAQEGAMAFLEYLLRPDIQNAYNADFLAFGTTNDAPPPEDPRLLDMQQYYDEARFTLGPSQFIPLTIPAENYIQSMMTGGDVGAILARMDEDWARIAFRESASGRRS